MTSYNELIIHNVHLASNTSSRSTAEQTVSVSCKGGIIQDIIPGSHGKSDVDVLDGKGGILLPSLCHSHIHLDKCNILDQCDELVSGSFQEAMEITSKAKRDYLFDDLISRGRRLILDSVKYGVTAMRAHVEVDRLVKFKCLDAGLQLQEELKHLCDIGLNVFAQDPIFSPTGEETDNLFLLQEAASKSGISSVGSAPYVEASADISRRNVDAIFDIALANNLHIDFHLDFGLSCSTEPFTPYVISRARQLDWHVRMPGKRITIGHATRLGLLSPEALTKLRQDIGDLPVTIVCLPQTDTYMLGPGAPLHAINLVQIHNLDIAMSVNNIGNAFTPQGSFDPINLCTFGVATFQAGTPRACGILLDSVSNVSKRSGGFAHSKSLALQKGDPADFVLIHGNSNVQSVVLNPSYERTVIKNGKVIASRTITDFVTDS